MKTNRKLIALICAISMIFSVFGAFTFTASAEEIEKGIVLEYNSKASSKTAASIDVYYTGMDSILGYTVKVNIPSGATVEYSDLTGLTAAQTPGETTFGVSAAGTTAVTPKDKKIGTLKITGVSADYEMSLQMGSGLTLADKSELYLGDDPTAADFLPVATATVLADPAATPAPTAATKPSQKPADEVVPTKAPVDVEAGITLELDKSSTAASKLVNVYYTGMDSILGYTVKVNIPSGATVEYSDLTGLTAAQTPGETTFGVSAAGTAAVTPKDKKIGTLKITADSIPADFCVELQNGSGLTLADKSELYLGDDPEASDYLPPAWVNISSSTGDKEIKKEMKLSDMVSADKITDANKNNDLYVTVSVDPEEAVYGVDYVAKYDGKELGPNEFINLISGYDATRKDMADIISKLTFDVFNTGVVKSIGAALNDGTANQQLDNGTETMGKPEPTKKPTAPSINVTVKPSTVYVGDSVVVTAKVTNPQADGVLTVAPSDESLDYVTASGIKSEVAEDNKTATTKFKAADKGKDAVVLNYTYTYTDKSGKTQTETEEKKITIKEKKTDNGGSSSNNEGSSGGGVIANGIYNPTGSVVMPGVNFKDLGEAPWASEAISVLASKNIIKGRDEYTFDPNANITRAEYCQILIGAIGQDGAYADAQFADVPTDAWFYHSVAVASQLGIVSGYGDGNFGPYDLITRQDMALMTMKATQAINKNLSSVANPSFTDDDQIAEYAYDAVHTLAQSGIINGMDDGSFAPRNNATRAQAALIIYSTFVK